MAYALHALGQLVSPWWSVARQWAGAMQNGAAAVSRVFGGSAATGDRVSVPPVSKGWLREHEQTSARRGDDV